MRAMKWIVVALALVACSKKKEAPPEPPQPKAAKIEGLALKPLPDKKLEVQFRVLDTAGKPMRAYTVGYKVLGCDAGPSIDDRNYDAAKNELATFQANLEFCGRPPRDYKITFDLHVGWESENVKATAEVDAKSAYERSGPRSLSELETELARLSTAGVNDDDPPFGTPNPDIGLISLVIDRIVEMEAAVIPKLLPVWKGPNQIRARVAAAAIGVLDPALLVKESIAMLDAYDAALAADPKARMSPAAMAAAAGVFAAGRLRNGVAADVYFRALSSPDPEVSGMAATWIKSNLPRDLAIDGLFRYMAAKQQYQQREIDIYVAVIEQFGAEASAVVAKNLDALLAAAKKPDKVFWAHKVVGLTALQKIGQPAAAPTVKKFQADKESYLSSKQKLDPMGNPVGMAETTPIPFAKLAGDALAALSSR